MPLAGGFSLAGYPARMSQWASERAGVGGVVIPDESPTVPLSRRRVFSSEVEFRRPVVLTFPEFVRAFASDFQVEPAAVRRDGWADRPISVQPCPSPGASVCVFTAVIGGGVGESRGTVLADLRGRWALWTLGELSRRKSPSLQPDTWRATVELVRRAFPADVDRALGL